MLELLSMFRETLRMQTLNHFYDPTRSLFVSARMCPCVVAFLSRLAAATLWLRVRRCGVGLVCASLVIVVLDVIVTAKVKIIVIAI